VNRGNNGFEGNAEASAGRRCFPLFTDATVDFDFPEKFRLRWGVRVFSVSLDRAPVPRPFFLDKRKAKWDNK